MPATSRRGRRARGVRWSGCIPTIACTALALAAGAPAWAEIAYEIEHVFDAGDEPVGVTSGDFSGDGATDIATVSREPTLDEGLLYIFPADGSGGFDPALIFTGPDLTNSEVASAEGDPSTLGRPVSINAAEINEQTGAPSLIDLIIARENAPLMLLENREFAFVFEELNNPGLGACCTDALECLITTPNECVNNFNGTFLGNNTSCFGVDCTAEPASAPLTIDDRFATLGPPVRSSAGTAPPSAMARPRRTAPGGPPPPPPGPGEASAPFDIADRAVVGDAGKTQDGGNITVVGISPDADPDSPGLVVSRIGNGSGGYPGQDGDEGIGANPMDLACADLDGDSNDDYVVANKATGTISVLVYRGEIIDPPATPDVLPVPRGIDWATPAEIQRTYAVGNAPCAVVVCRIDGDALLDVAVLNSGDDEIQILLGNGDGTFAPDGTVAVPAGSSLLECGDIDGDADDDLVVAGADTGTGFVRSYANDGSGGFAPGPKLEVGGELAALTIGRFAGSASSPLDAAVVSRDTDELIVLRGTPAADECLGDLDGDDDVDEDDAAIIFAAIGTTEGDAGYVPAADYDGDGAVGLADYAIWYGYFADFQLSGVC